MEQELLLLQSLADLGINENLVKIIENGIVSILIIGSAWLLLSQGKRLIRRISSVGRIDQDKQETLVSLLNSIMRYVIWVVAILLVIKVFAPNFEIAPILAAAGVVGLAVGFGAQNLIRDVINGFFLIFEDQIRVGDSVLVNGEVFGMVEEVGLRMTALREWSGRKFYIANAEIRTISNYNRRELRAIVAATFPFEEDPKQIRQLLNDVVTEFTAKYPQYLLVDENGSFVEPPQILGVTDINKDGLGGQYEVIALTKPAYFWTTERTLREMIWARARERGIRLAYPHRILEHHEEFKDRTTN